MIYFAQPTDGGPVKIGCSGDVETRLRQLESHYGRPLALLGTMEGDRDEERAIHERFAHLRLGRTEQFQPAPDLMEFIGRPLLVDPNPDAVEVMPTSDGRVSILLLKGTPKYRDWLTRLAEYARLSRLDVIDHGLVELAKEVGFPDPPPKR